MFRLPITFAFLMILLQAGLALPTWTATAGPKGDWGSAGGGIGVACFESVEVSKVIAKHLSASPLLSKDDKAKIQSLNVLDYWDQLQNLSLIKTPNNRAALLEKVFYRLRDVSPLFALRLQQLEPRISEQKWIENQTEVGAWENTHDAHPLRDVPANCQLVQLAVRRSKPVAEFNKYPLRLPEISVYFDPDLYARLDSLNQAMLIVHEELYLMAQSIGHKDSDLIRQLVGNFFSVSFHEVSLTAKIRRDMQQDIGKLLADYVFFFLEEQILPNRENAPPFSQISRYYSFASAIGKGVEDLNKCKAEKKLGAPPRGLTPAQYLSHVCMDEVNDPDYLSKSRSEEESFVLFARFAIDTMKKNYRNSEYIVTPFLDNEFKAQAYETLTNSCIGTFDLYSDSIGAKAEPLARRALDYCLHGMAAHVPGFVLHINNAPRTIADKFSFYFSEDQQSAREPIPELSSRSRAQSYSSARAKIATQIRACARMRVHPDDESVLQRCADQANEPTFLASLVTDEEAFMLYVHYELDRHSPEPSKATGYLSQEVQGRKERQDQFAALVQACDMMFDARVENDRTAIEQLSAKALNYCILAIDAYHKEP